MDYRVNWVPAHYFRYLLSVVGGGIVGFLGHQEAEVWRMRALGRTFRYGVASAYEKAVGGLHPRGEIDEGPRGISTQDQPAEVPEVDVGDDPTVDQVRHVPDYEELGEPLQAVQLFRAEPDESSESEWTDASTTTSGLSEGSRTGGVRDGRVYYGVVLRRFCLPWYKL